MKLNACDPSPVAFLSKIILILFLLIHTSILSFAMTSNDSWIDGLKMEQYTPPADDEAQQSSTIESNALWQIPAGIAWNNDNGKQESSSLNLSTCVDPNTAETVLQWKALQKSEFLIQKLVKENAQRGSLPVGACQIHLGGTSTIKLDLIKPIQVIDDDKFPCELRLGTDLIQRYDIQVDLSNHLLVVPQGESCVTVPFIQPRSEIEMPSEE